MNLVIEPQDLGEGIFRGAVEGNQTDEQIGCEEEATKRGLRIASSTSTYHVQVLSQVLHMH